MANAVRTAPDPSAEAAETTPHPRRPTLDDVWAFLPVAIPMLVSLASRMVAVDLAYHVRVGEGILAGGGIPRVNTLSFVNEGAAWLDQQWLAQVFIAIAHRGGFATVALLRACLIGGSFGLIYLSCRAKGASPRASSLLSLSGFIVCLQALAMRPQLLAFFLFSASLWILSTRHTHPRRCWALVGIAVVWANVHGSFFLLPLLCALAAGEDLIGGHPGWRRMARFAVGCAVATLVNPFGAGVWSYVVELSTNPVIRQTITEWAPMSVSTFAGTAFFLTAALIAGWLARREGVVPWPALLWLGTFFVLALPARRGVLWWSLVAPVVVAGLLDLRRGTRTMHTGTRWMNLTVIALLGATVLAFLPWSRGLRSTDLLAEAPVGLTAAAREHLPHGANVLTPQAWGSWFEFDAPEQQVFLDARVELQPQAAWDDYNAVRTARGDWGAILDRWSVDAVVVDARPGWEELEDALAGSSEWCLATSDVAGSLFIRDDAVDGRCIAS